MTDQPATDQPATDPLLTVTPLARGRVEGFRDAVEDPASQAMWVEVTGESAGEYSTNIYLRSTADAEPQDTTLDAEGLPVVVPADSASRLAGATVDWIEEPGRTGLVVENPNKPAAAPTMLPMMGTGAPAPASPPVPSAPPADLSGELAQRVQTVITENVNPAIAAHGGMAELVAVEDNAAYLRLGGGCQGCGMASVTLTQGISTAIQQAVPEIERVVDVTDHAAGSNPYFESSKK
ncbi:MAG: NifU family protein [Solirubrobacterales bacterium]